MSSPKKFLPVVPRRNSEGNETAEPVLAMPASGIDPDWRERIEFAKREYEESKKLREGKLISGIDPDWRERIELAKWAYEDGKKLREGKPITFPIYRPLDLGDGYNG